MRHRWDGDWPPQLPSPNSCKLCCCYDYSNFVIFTGLHVEWIWIYRRKWNLKLRWSDQVGLSIFRAAGPSQNKLNGFPLNLPWFTLKFLCTRLIRQVVWLFVDGSPFPYYTSIWSLVKVFIIVCEFTKVISAIAPFLMTGLQIFFFMFSFPENRPKKVGVQLYWRTIIYPEDSIILWRGRTWSHFPGLRHDYTTIRYKDKKMRQALKQKL